MIYRILLNTKADFSAPETVYLDNFNEVGTIEAKSKGEAYIYLNLIVSVTYKETVNRGYRINLELDEGARLRQIMPGDVLVDENNISYILTPAYVWSVVKMVI